MSVAPRLVSLPTVNGNGHRIGCVCAGCAAYRARQLDLIYVRCRNANAHTLLKLLLEVLQEPLK